MASQNWNDGAPSNRFGRFGLSKTNSVRGSAEGMRQRSSDFYCFSEWSQHFIYADPRVQHREIAKKRNRDIRVNPRLRKNSRLQGASADQDIFHRLARHPCDLCSNATVRYKRTMQFHAKGALFLLLFCPRGAPARGHRKVSTRRLLPDR